MSIDISLILGDAIHNLRAALDLLAFELVALSGETPDKWTNFPIRDARNELVATINGGKIKAAHATIIDLIVDTIKPYKGGNDPLYALHNLDILDKHRLLIPVASVTKFLGVIAETEEGGRIKIGELRIKGGGNMNLIKSSIPYNITDYGKPSFDILFGKGQIFDGEPVIPTLHQLSELVSGIGEAIEEAYLAIS